MEKTIPVLMTCPMDSYLEAQLDRRFSLLRLWTSDNPTGFIAAKSSVIRAVVGNASVGASKEMIEALPKLEIVASYSVGLDKVDLEKCRERGVRVSNTPDVLTEDVADLAIGLVLAVLRRLSESDRYVRGGFWKKGDFKLTTKCDKKDLLELEIVASFSVGLDKVDLGKCRERGVRVSNTPDVLTGDVADLAIRLILAVLRRLCESDRYVKGGYWKIGDFKLTTKFTGKRVGILGLGRIGLAIAKRAEAFNCLISYHTRREKSGTAYKYYPSVLELASNCDILIVVCPLTEQTRHIINRQVIEALGPKGVLINIGRGPHVDEPELVSALVEGRLGGAGLDVFENEPHVPEELFKLDNVVLTPHVGSGTYETRKDMADLVIGNLEAHFSNKPLLSPVV